MSKIRVSTTVEESLLAEARQSCGGAKDSSVLEQALRALLAQHRSAVIDRQIDEKYSEIPFDVADEWGSLADFVHEAGQEPSESEVRDGTAAAW